ncbi:UDP-glucose 4-epimerase [Vibrio splendidus]|uniref:NAD-dependent epimerase/dehydratase family protein n=1 Tax=Vibrio splendidus TaxID=29497 RepID=UPI000D3DBA95|nr:NAD-dependent epimerase/dehydratase family protein [Vibrio splendidus]PTP86651.1 UDP-glucose 4-epimerase [Vibrio splendidus]
MRTLVTGATGFVGRELINTLDNVCCVIRKNQKHAFDISYEVESIDGGTLWTDECLSVDVIVHLAGIAHDKSCSLEKYISVNTDGTLKLARDAALKGVKRFVFVSSIGVNGSFTNDKPFRPDSNASPHNAYAYSKYMAELGLQKIQSDTGMEVVIVRPTLVYGVGARGNFGMLTKLIEYFPILPFGLTNNRRDFISVKNLASLLNECVYNPNAVGHIFLASDMNAVTMKQFTQTIAKSLGKVNIQLPVPISIMRFFGKVTGKSSVVEQLVGNLEVDSSNVIDVLGWTPPYTMEESMNSLSNKNDREKNDPFN